MAPKGFVEKALKQARRALRESGQYWPHAFLFDQNRQVDVFVFEPEIMSSKSRRSQRTFVFIRCSNLTPGLRAQPHSDGHESLSRSPAHSHSATHWPNCGRRR